MHSQGVSQWQPDHTFGQDQIRDGERRTVFVVALTAVMMVVEIVAGLAFGSMALLADGVHMASHVTALSITVIAYIYARTHARDNQFNFGTGKVNALAGFTSAILLAGFALFMAWESAARLLSPVPIAFDQAILVAIIGLGVNALSMFLLRDRSAPDHAHPHDHEHGHHHSHGDHNLRAAYLHVLTDACTSLLAIVALLTGKWYQLIWMDPLMGILGAGLITKWLWGLLRDTSHVLLDRQAPMPVRDSLRQALEGDTDETRIADLHVWSIGPGIYAGEVVLVADSPQPPDFYKALVPQHLNIVHATIEIHRCPHH